MTSTNKVYLEILKQLRAIIDEDGLIPGDKIPSERELSDRLNAGRSSVREALRALELLGIIETRRGEGTYIKDFGEHQLVNILGTFILQDEKAKSDLLETKHIIERDCLVLACERMDEELINSLILLLKTDKTSASNVFKTIVESTNNRLLLRIWLVINEYMKAVNEPPSDNLVLIEELLSCLKQRNVKDVLVIYQKLAQSEIVEP
ncbi:GntR family transcriptional regulator [Bacillus timonensis]|nr:GntR family transcriptional regulator [Bacillus timonensis]